MKGDTKLPEETSLVLWCYNSPFTGKTNTSMNSPRCEWRGTAFKSLLTKVCPPGLGAFLPRWRPSFAPTQPWCLHWLGSCPNFSAKPLRELRGEGSSSPQLRLLSVCVHSVRRPAGVCSVLLRYAAPVCSERILTSHPPTSLHGEEAPSADLLISCHFASQQDGVFKWAAPATWVKKKIHGSE